MRKFLFLLLLIPILNVSKGQEITLSDIQFLYEYDHDDYDSLVINLVKLMEEKEWETEEVDTNSSRKQVVLRWGIDEGKKSFRSLLTYSNKRGKKHVRFETANKKLFKRILVDVTATMDRSEDEQGLSGGSGNSKVQSYSGMGGNEVSYTYFTDGDKCVIREVHTRKKSYFQILYMQKD